MAFAPQRETSAAEPEEGEVMQYRKCPKCDINYIREDEELCKACRGELDQKASRVKDLKRSEVIHAGDTFPFSKNSELITFLTGKQVGSCRRATYKLTDTCYMWMIALDGKARKGWKDCLLKDGRIKETYVGDKNDLPSNFSLTFDVANKAVFEKGTDEFVFRGIYKLSAGTNSIYERVYEKIADEATLKDF